MAVLQRSQTPEAAFDPTNVLHREAYYTFLKNGRWKDNIRFILNEPFTTVPTMIAAGLLNFYMDKEFKNVD